MFEAACCTVEKCFCFPCLCSMNYTPRLKTQFTQSLYFTCQATRSMMGHETYSFPAELSRLPRGEEDGGAGPGLGSSSRRVKVTFKVNRWIHFVCLFMFTYRSANASNNNSCLSFKIKALPVPCYSISSQLEGLQANLSAHLNSRDMKERYFCSNSPHQTTY